MSLVEGLTYSSLDTDFIKQFVQVSVVGSNLVHSCKVLFFDCCLPGAQRQHARAVKPVLLMEQFVPISEISNCCGGLPEHTPLDPFLPSRLLHIQGRHCSNRPEAEINSNG